MDNFAPAADEAGEIAAICAGSIASMRSRTRRATTGEAPPVPPTGNDDVAAIDDGGKR